MSLRVVRPPRAYVDILDLADRLARESLSVSMRFTEAVDRSLSELANMPGLGSLWESESAEMSGIRFWPVEGFPRHLIFYRASATSLEVIRVLHASQDLDSLFENM